MPVDYAANLAFFLLEHTGSIFGTWAGRLPKSEQQIMFGKHIGKGTIVIDVSHETVCNRVKVAFGRDYDDRNVLRWQALECNSL